MVKEKPFFGFLVEHHKRRGNFQKDGRNLGWNGYRGKEVVIKKFIYPKHKTRKATTFIVHSVKLCGTKYSIEKSRRKRKEFFKISKM